MKIKSFLILICVAFVFTSCSGRSRNGIDVGDNNLVDPDPASITYCSSVVETPTSDGDTHKSNWGGINTFRMLNDSCYASAMACTPFEEDGCYPYQWTNEQREEHMFGKGGLHDVCGWGNTDPAGTPAEDCDNTYLTKFIKCDGNIFILNAAHSRDNDYRANCSNLEDYSRIDLGTKIYVSRAGTPHVFVLTSDIQKSFVIELTVSYMDGLVTKYNVPSLQNLLSQELAECLVSLSSSSSKEGAFCEIVNTRYGAEVAGLY